jgi:hypothetical protein
MEVPNPINPDRLDSDLEKMLRDLVSILPRLTRQTPAPPAPPGARHGVISGSVTGSTFEPLRIGQQKEKRHEADVEAADTQAPF